MKKGDVALIIIAVIFLVLWLIPKPSGTTVTIMVDGEVYKKISLDEDCEIPIISEYGKNTVVIRDGECYIADADCPDKLCEDSKISKSGESIVCLPNRLSVTIETEEKEADVIL